jgi:hypothetical protein
MADRAGLDVLAEGRRVVGGHRRACEGAAQRVLAWRAVRTGLRLLAIGTGLSRPGELTRLALTVIRLALTAIRATWPLHAVRTMLALGAIGPRHAELAGLPLAAELSWLSLSVIGTRLARPAELTGLPSRIVRTRLPLRGVRVCLALGAVWARLPVLAEIGWPGGPAGRGVPRC